MLCLLTLMFYKTHQLNLFLNIQYYRYKKEFSEAIESVLEKGDFILGDAVYNF